MSLQIRTGRDHACNRDSIGDHIRGLVQNISAFEDFGEGSADRFDARHQLFSIGVIARASDVDYPAGVDDIVGGVEDAALGEQPSVVVLRKLVVGGPGDHIRLYLRNALVVDDCAKCARNVHVRIKSMDRFRCDRRCAKFVHSVSHSRWINIAHEQSRTRLPQMSRDAQANTSHALHCDP